MSTRHLLCQVMEDFAEQNKTIVCEPDSPSGYDVLGVKIVDTFLRMDPPDPEAEGPQIRGHYRIDVEYDTKVRFVMLQNGQEIEGQESGAGKTIVLGFEGRFSDERPDLSWKIVDMPTR